MAAPRTFVISVAWNDRDFLPELLGSLCPAPLEDAQVLVIDNGSDDNPGAFVRAQFPHVALLRNARNLGYAHALNQALRYAFDAWAGEDLEDRSVLLVSPDMRLAPGCLDALRAALAAHPDAASVCGTVLRAFRDPSSEHPIAEAVKSDVLESAGLGARADRTFFPRGAGELDRGQFKEDEPFGAPPGLGLYRASALDAIRVGDRVADPDVHATQVVADLAWRLRSAGGTTRHVPTARAYRFCGVQSATAMTALATRTQSGSPRDRWELVLKNEPASTLALSAPRLALAWLAGAWRSPAAFAAPVAALLRLPSIWPKRRAGKAARRLRASDLARLFG